MSRRFTLSGLLLGVTLIGLLLALIVPQARHFARASYYSDEVIEVAASADGTTFGALLGDGRVLVWDNEGNLKATLHTLGTFGGRLALSFDGGLAAVSPCDPGMYVNAYFDDYPRGTVEIWDIAKRKVRRALPLRATAPMFSTAGNLLIVNSSPLRFEMYSADNDGPPRVVPAGGASVAFSPDGARIATGTVPGRLEIWDLATLYKEREFLTGQTAHLWYNRVAWAPDGQSIAGLVWQDDQTLALESWNLATGVEKPISRRVTDDNGVQLAFSPDGRHLFVVNPRRDGGLMPGPTQVFGADTLEPVESSHLADAWGLAGGMRGATFVSSEQYTVDLVDTATLQPLRRLYDAPSPPNVWPAVVGLAAWLGAFAARLVRQRWLNERRDDQALARIAAVPFLGL